MSAKTVKIDDPVDTEINRGAAGTGLSKKAVLEKAVMYYVPRVLRGEISIVELPQAPREVLIPLRAQTGE